VGRLGGDDDRLASRQRVRRPVDGHLAGAVEYGDESIAAGLVGTDFFALVESEQRQANRRVLDESPADDLLGLVIHFARQVEDGTRADVAQNGIHSFSFLWAFIATLPW